MRQAAFEFLTEVEAETGGPVRRIEVADFYFMGNRIPLMDLQRGIRKPQGMDSALSIRTVFSARPDQMPYEDIPGPDGLLRYKWRGDESEHPENRAMRVAMERRLPLIWFHPIESGTYLPIYPVFLAAEEPSRHQFVVALGDEQMYRIEAAVEFTADLHRGYVERVVKERLHQPVFRARVLAAYDGRCSICHLRHRQLLDAAHIRADRHGGRPVVTNGISMCKIHHAAYDADMLGVDPSCRVIIRPDLLIEKDGPTLQHALQGLHKARLQLPRLRAARPDPELLGERFESFKRAADSRSA